MHRHRDRSCSRSQPGRSARIRGRRRDAVTALSGARSDDEEHGDKPGREDHNTMRSLRWCAETRHRPVHRTRAPVVGNRGGLPVLPRRMVRAGLRRRDSGGDPPGPPRGTRACPAPADSARGECSARPSRSSRGARPVTGTSTGYGRRVEDDRPRGYVRRDGTRSLPAPTPLRRSDSRDIVRLTVQSERHAGRHNLRSRKGLQRSASRTLPTSHCP